jgi:hypothetical protein
MPQTQIVLLIFCTCVIKNSIKKLPMTNIDYFTNKTFSVLNKKSLKKYIALYFLKEVIVEVNTT